MISVILPTYNRAKEIPKSIESILNQTYKDFELIIIDDGSTDNTQEVVATYQDHRIHYIKNMTSEHGVSTARNIGIRESKGEYITFNDSDDIFYSDKLERQLAFIERKKADVTFCAVCRNQQIIPDRKFEQKECTLEKILEASFTTTQALFGRAECFKECMFDERISRNVDWELVIRLIRDYTVVFQKEVLAELIATEVSISADPNNAVISMNYILDKYRELYDQYPKSRKKMELAVKYQTALANDMELLEKMKEDKSAQAIFRWIQHRLMRYLYILRIMLLQFGRAK